MGPRHLSRGIRRLSCVFGRHDEASMGPRHLSRGIKPSFPTLAAVLNVASMGPRHLSRGIFPSFSRILNLREASMGPRHLSRGISPRGHRIRHARPCFNGATAFEPWNQPPAKWPLALVFWRRLRAPRLVADTVPSLRIAHLLCVNIVTRSRRFLLIVRRERCWDFAHH